jgi:hypothetical protein
VGCSDDYTACAEFCGDDYDCVYDCFDDFCSCVEVIGCDPSDYSC